MTSKRCPDCGNGLSVTAQACGCGWSASGRKSRSSLVPITTHPMHARCRVERCTSLVDGDDRLCGQHRALARGPEEFERWQLAGIEWRQALFRDWRSRHRDDAWGSALRVSHEIAKGRASVDDKRELLDFLRREIPKIGKGGSRPVRRIESPELEAQRVIEGELA